ncbi:hypothetical protein B0J11DRAFT_96104 [Dendryphion nanum]|uniref:BZIP domain-containing protein n=1 Tax=Dendryphion nanum TaxID=256645 RepID=A0A9P9IEM8_9PLEO|nr:hypothetical protein B0J11DRAFT_96104 [Dendryphion nanum]
MDSQDLDEVSHFAPSSHASQTEHVGDDKGQKPKRKPNRRDPEKRRLQNIQAQKKYREKLKKRLDDLETLAAFVADGSIPAVPATPDSVPNLASGAPCVTSSMAVGPVPSDSANVAHNIHTIPKSGSALLVTGPSTDTFTVSTSRITEKSGAPVDLPGFYASYILQTQSGLSNRVIPESDDAHHSILSFSDENHLDLSDLMPQISTSPSPSTVLTLWEPTTETVQNQQISTHDDMSPPRYLIGHIDCGCFMLHLQISSSGQTGHRYQEIAQVSTSLITTDPYINSLGFDRVCLVQAVMENCLHIGITENMYCDEDSMSPFYRPGSEKNYSGANSVVTRMQENFKSIKPDVRPVKEQITIAHSPIIDVLPFPTFRRNFLLSLDSLDQDEVYFDLVNGLICWGGRSISQKDRNTNTGFVSTGTPWDSRSWEGRPWFLQKYWAMLGGDDGELVRQSEWWRSMRGEEPDPWLNF